MLRATLDVESQWDVDMQTRITDVFESIFFEFTNGLADRTRLKPCDARAYINKWRDLAAWRDEVIPNANAQLRRFSGTSVAEVRDLYYGHFLTTMRSDQDKKRLRSRFALRLKTEAGSRFVASAVWEIGLPRLPAFATEQRPRPLSAEELQDVPIALRRILNWLDSLAVTLVRHRATEEYQTAKRRYALQLGHD